ncbi:golgin subfamily A member 2-like [Ixodes scapularis]
MNDDLTAVEAIFGWVVQGTYSQAINDQLQVPIQTIGILVAEKAELQSALSQSQQTAKQKAVETEELQGRLKAARERNTDLERKLNSVSSQSQVQEKSFREYLREIERFKTEQYKSSKSIEELKQELSELSNQLGKKTKDNEALQQELGDVKRELFLAPLNAPQLEDAQAFENVYSQLEELAQEKLGMEKKVNRFKDAMEQIAAEKRPMSSHYQSFVDRLSAVGNKQGNAGEMNTHGFSTSHIRVTQRRLRVFNRETTGIPPRVACRK